MTRLFLGPLLLLVCVSSGVALWPSRPGARNALNLPATPYRYTNVELPAHFTQPGRNHDKTPPDNPLSDDGATLGRVLFYDTRLSANNTTSCASCHVQAHAFADPRPFSKGFHGALTDRRAMPLVNVRYYQRARFFWDERAGNLEEMDMRDANEHFFVPTPANTGLRGTDLTADGGGGASVEEVAPH